MTVQQLIERLQELPQGANISLEIIDAYTGKACSHSDNAEFSVYGAITDEVVIQAIG